jgi:hypothetical protein
VAAVAIVTGLAGCAEPGVKQKPYATQHSLSNVRDWDAAAKRLLASLEDQGFIPTDSPREGRKPYKPPYYINVMAQGSAFLDHVKQSLEWDLLDQDFTISRTPVGATVINLDINVVNWGSSIYAPGARGGFVPEGFFEPSRTELVWRASIVEGGKLTVKGRETVYIPSSDIPLYLGAGALPAMSTPGPSVVGATVPLRYVR